MDPNQNIPPFNSDYAEPSSGQFTNFQFYSTENLRSLHEYEKAMYVTPLHQVTQELENELEPQRTTTKKKNYILRDRREAHNRLFKDYFADDSTYTEDQFRRRLRMNKKVFMRIVNDLSSDEYFPLRYNATKTVETSPIQKCTTVVRMLAYGMPADACDEYMKIGASTAIECLKRFCNGVVHLYQGIYLRKPNVEDLERLLRVAEDRGFPGMIGSIDCMHWEWKNCPVGWQGQFTEGHQRTATIILEVVASFDLWIWYAFFGLPGTLNDINMLDRSPVFDDVEQADIYPINSGPQGGREKLFVERQEAYRKDVERAFGVLQSRFQIIRQPARLWDLSDLSTIMRACIILHNMIVEDERDNYAYNQDFAQYDQSIAEESSSSFQYTINVLPQFAAHVRTRAEPHDKEGHHQLKNDLIQHV